MKTVKRFFRSIQFKIPMLFILLLVISLQLIVANFLTQLESQMVSNFQEQIQLQVGFLKNNVQPILAKDATDEAKIAEISQLLQDYPTGNSIVEIRCKGIFWEQRTKRSNLWSERVQRKQMCNKLLFQIPFKAITLLKEKRVIGNMFHQLIQ